MELKKYWDSGLKHAFSVKIKITMGVKSGFGEGNGTPLQYSCLEKSHGWSSLVGCSP